MLANLALDPSFGQRGLVLGAVVPQPAADEVSGSSAVAVQGDGKIIVVNGQAREDSTTQTSDDDPAALTIQRFNADGSPDATFGSGGQTTIALPTGTSVMLGRKALVVDADGQIIFIAGMIEPTESEQSVIFRLTSAGAVDSTFGAGGEFVVPLDTADFNSVAVQTDGKIVAAGDYTLPSGERQIGIVRVTAAGALDPSFNGTGEVAVLADPFDPGLETAFPAGVALDPGGQIVVAATFDYESRSISGLTSYASSLIARYNGDGSVDSAFGTAGTVVLSAFDQVRIAGLAVQPDGKVVLDGSGFVLPTDVDSASHGIIRLLDNGEIDPSFVPAHTGGADLAIGADGTITTFLSVPLENTDTTHDKVILDRYLPTGAADPTFGTRGQLAFEVRAASASATAGSFAVAQFSALALTSSGQILLAGVVTTFATTTLPGDADTHTTLATQSALAGVLPTATNPATPGDYDGDGKSDVAAALEAFGLFAVRQSSGAGDLVESFGPATLGGAIPAPGDYDGDGKTDIAAYLPAFGLLAYRPSSGGTDVLVPFGIPGTGQSIPAPGDYDGDGKTDVAVYLPALGDLAYRPSSGGADVIIPFGSAGLGQSIPAPGDYDGDGKTDPAVYLPNFGILAYRPSSGGADVLVPFGVPGAGQTIPAPGDYDGDGKTDIAVYLPALGDFAYRPSSGGADVIEPFGIAGAGQSIAAPGDYDGDGKTDIAVYLPALGDFAYRPSSGGADVVEQFGLPGTGQTVPAGSILAAQPATTTTGTVAIQAVAASIPWADEALEPGADSGHGRKKKHANHSA